MLIPRVNNVRIEIISDIIIAFALFSDAGGSGCYALREALHGDRRTERRN